MGIPAGSSGGRLRIAQGFGSPPRDGSGSLKPLAPGSKLFASCNTGYNQFGVGYNEPLLNYNGCYNVLDGQWGNFYISYSLSSQVLIFKGGRVFASRVLALSGPKWQAPSDGFGGRLP